MPLFNRAPGWLSHCSLVMTVSLHCLALLRKAGMERVYPEPMYGFPDPGRAASTQIIARSPYRWDRAKVRDALLGTLEPLTEPFRRRAAFERRSGLTLGIVSQIVPIKQFPELLPHFAPFIARHQANLEIFGAGGYAQLRDLKRALAPIRDRVRFWGHQQNVAAIYPQMDYLLSGLPEREALGLNVLEAQICGTPVLAPDAPPFVETVAHGESGFLYRDPREDGGRDLEQLLESIAAGRPRPDPREAREHLAKFSYPALVERTRRLLDALRTRMPA
jgi:glycosyltransferase involved in cell wall biosynthesis